MKNENRNDKYNSSAKKLFKEQRQNLYRDLKMVDLKGKDEETKAALVIKALKECHENIPMQVLGELNDGIHSGIVSMYEDSYIHPIEITSLYHLHFNKVAATITLGRVPFEKKLAVYEMLNLLNVRFSAYHFSMGDDRVIQMRAGMHFSRAFNPSDYFLLLWHLLKTCTVHYPLLEETMDSDDLPEDIMNRFHEKMADYAANLLLN